MKMKKDKSITIICVYCGNYISYGNQNVIISNICEVLINLRRLEVHEKIYL